MSSQQIQVGASVFQNKHPRISRHTGYRANQRERVFCQKNQTG